MSTLQSPDNHLVFSATIGVLFREVLSEQVTPPVQERLKAVGIDLARTLDPAYPVRVFDDAMEVVAVHGMPELEKTAALRRIGELQVEAFSRTLLGKASFQFLRLLSHRRYLDRMTKSFRNANNYVEAKVEQVEPQVFRVWINDVGRFPEVFQGILTGASRAAGHTCEITVAEREGLACWYALKFG